MARFNDQFARPEEDWSGLKDAKARRRLQTRLNVRAHRKRKAGQERQEESQVLASHRNQAHALFNCFQTPSPFVLSSSYLLSPESWTDLDAYARSHQWNRFSRLDYSARARLPLSPDHLLNLAQYNLVRASTTNAMILSVHHLIQTDRCGLDFENMPLFPPSSASWEIPEPLRPTRLQLETPHEFWVDLVPDPKLRDNVLLALIQGKLNTVEFQGDLVGSICKENRNSLPSPLTLSQTQETPYATAAHWKDGSGCSLSEQRELGMLVWSDPWCMEGYEVTPAFLNKWKFLFKGCQHIVDATNRWRQRRGEKPLVVEL